MIAWEGLTGQELRPSDLKLTLYFYLSYTMCFLINQINLFLFKWQTAGVVIFTFGKSSKRKLTYMCQKKEKQVKTEAKFNSLAVGRVQGEDPCFLTNDPSMDLGSKDSERCMWAPVCSWPKKRVEGIWESKQNRLQWVTMVHHFPIFLSIWGDFYVCLASFLAFALLILLWQRGKLKDHQKRLS